MAYTPTIFPELLTASWAKVDLNALACAEFPHDITPNPLTDGSFCQSWIDCIAKKENADFTWGGYREDRKRLWRGYYPDAPRVTHLGIDYNVPAGTLVAAPANCVVVHTMVDHEQENGWGGRLIVRLDRAWKGAPFLILGHLAHDRIPEAGQPFKKGDALARTGKIQENGGWFPHLHVQCCSAAFFETHQDDLTQLDGYYLEAGDPAAIAPDPTLLVGSFTIDGNDLSATPLKKASPTGPR